MSNVEIIPAVLFAFARPSHLKRALECLRENQVPLLYVFSDGSKGKDDAQGVIESRTLLHAVDWCEVRLTERPENLGLGRNIISGLNEVARHHSAFIVWEDDLICVPGTYAWMCAALRHYESQSRVMSVTAWNHPRVTPGGLHGQPYFDGRAECWVWGTWRRAWHGVAEETAREKLDASTARGIPPDAYGADLPLMAKAEQLQNIWAVRWLYHHFQHGGLCLRPPWSMVEHIGFDLSATNAAAATAWANPPLQTAPDIPVHWPEPREHESCQSLWRATRDYSWRSLLWRIRAKVTSR